MEEYLDEIFPNWEIFNFTYDWKTINNREFISGKLTLRVQDEDKLFRDVIGSCTFLVRGNEDNQDYVATLQSFCVANAAKRLGRRFGRGLNNRLAMGENSPTETAIAPVELADEKTSQNYINNLPSFKTK